MSPVEDGTGIVHTAPAFGEDDYQYWPQATICRLLNPVDERGKYTDTPWKGRFVMEDGLDVEIIKWLAGENKIFAKEKIGPQLSALLEMRNSAGLLREAQLVH